MDLPRLLRRAKANLNDAFGERFAGVVLYGSRARGQADTESDIDLLVLLNAEPSEPADSRKCIDALYGIVLESGVPIHAEPVSIDQYKASSMPLYRNARREGVAV